MIEIERKFLVTSNEYRGQAFKKTLIKQGFLNTDPDRTVRIRIKGDQGFLTVKGKSNAAGTIRTEWEKVIGLAEALGLFKLCEPGTIEKIRYEVKSGKHVIEIDEFCNDNSGLIVAEIELESENEKFIAPSWLGKEVTGDVRYYNSQLSKKPFNTWT
jgi:CYTH domain-containing protein